MCEIDVSQATAHLRLKRPVHIEVQHSSEVELMVAVVTTGAIRAGGSSPEDGDHHVFVDPDAASFAGVSLVDVVAHELYHLKQQEDIGVAHDAKIKYALANLYAQSTHQRNHFEEEADAHIEDLRNLIKVRECGSPISVYDEGTWERG